MKLPTIEFAGSNLAGELTSEDYYISSLDPLQADQMMPLIPQYNQQRDTIALVLALVDMLPSLAEAEGYDTQQAAAAMRDIGIMLGSLKRHGVEPENVIPELEEKLRRLGNLSDLPPRDTLIHYVRWNPEGNRQRTYTGTSDERQLIKSVKIAFSPLHQAINLLDELYEIPLHTPYFVAVCEEAASHFEAMVQGIVHAKRQVSPQYFSEELRFYFDPITLSGHEYLGPGAVEMPVFIFDHILWSCDLNDAKLTEFKESYTPYSQLPIRQLYQKYQGMPSLTSQVIQALASEPSHTAQHQRSVKSFQRLFTLLKSFRAPHKKLAEKAYKHAQKSEYRDKGSGGYSPSILQYILQRNLEVLDRLKESVATSAV